MAGEGGARQKATGTKEVQQEPQVAIGSNETLPHSVLHDVLLAVRVLTDQQQQMIDHQREMMARQSRLLERLFDRLDGHQTRLEEQFEGYHHHVVDQIARNQDWLVDHFDQREQRRLQEQSVDHPEQEPRAEQQPRQNQNQEEPQPYTPPPSGQEQAAPPPVRNEQADGNPQANRQAQGQPVSNITQNGHLPEAPLPQYVWPYQPAGQLQTFLPSYGYQPWGQQPSTQLLPGQQQTAQALPGNLHRAHQHNAHGFAPTRV